jgi:hypothetical protein
VTDWLLLVGLLLLLGAGLAALIGILLRCGTPIICP